MPPRWNSYDESSNFVDLSRDSMSPYVTKTTHIPYNTKRFVQPAKRQKNSSGHSSSQFLGGQSTSTSNPSPTTASQLSNSKPSSHPGFFPCFTCTIPDNSPYVHYGGVWTLNGGQLSNTHSTTVSGSTISLQFNGSGIVVFGTVPASNDTFQPPTAVYHLDNDPPFSTTLPLAAKDIPNQPLFASSSLLSDGQHTLLINVTDVEAPYSLAKFFVHPSDSTQDMIGQIPSGGILSTTISSTSTVTSPTPQIAPSTSTTANSKDASQKSVRTLAAVLATILLLALTGMIVFFIFRRRILAKRRLAGEVPPASRPDTQYSFFTSTESILRNDSDFWSSSFRSPRSQHSREGRSFGSRSFINSPVNGRRSTIDFAPPPLPPKPKPALLASSTKPG